MESRDSATAAGSSSRSGNGDSQGKSSGDFDSFSISGSQEGPDSPAGSQRRFRSASAVRHALVAMRYSQVRSDARAGSYADDDRHAQQRFLH
jgi:hypothetical protein